MLKRRLSLVLCLFALAAPVFGQSAAFVDDRGRDVSRHAEVTRIYVRLTDPTLDVSGGRDTAQITLTSTAGGDTEAVTLRETSDRTGVFSGGIEVWGGDGSPFWPGTLEVFRDPAAGYPDDTISLYRDGVLADTATVVSSITQLLNGRGEEVSSYAAGERVHVRVQDRFYQTPGPDSALVRIQTSAGDDETLPLVEASIRTGLFEGSLPGRTGTPVPGDGTVQTAPGVTITARHDDLNAVTFSSYTVPITAHSVAFVDAQGDPVTTVFPGSRGFLRVVDKAANTFPLDRDFVTVQVASQLGEDSEHAYLTETGPSTGVFEGWVSLAPDRFGSPEDGTLTAYFQGPDQFDTVTAAYATADGTSTATAETRWSVTRILDDFGRDAGFVVIGGEVRVRVEDPAKSQSFPNGLGTSTVTLHSSSAGDVETLTVEDAEIFGAAFEGTMPVATGAASPGDGVLQVLGTADTVTATSVDSNGETSSSDTAGVAYNLTRFLDERGNPTELLFEFSDARVQVLEPTNNGGYSTMSVRSELTGRTRDLSLSPVEGSAGTFEGSIYLSFVDPVFGNPDFATGLPVTRRANSSDPFDTVTAEYYHVATSSAAARTVSSVTRFLDAFGNDAASYVAGQRIYLEVRNPSRSDIGAVLQTTVRITSLLTGDEEVLTLDETAELSGLFTGSLPSSTAVAAQGDGVLQTLPGDSLSALHDVDLNWDAWSVDTAAVTWRSIGFVGAQGKPVDLYLQDGMVYVRASDLGANLNPAQPDLVQVRIVSEQDGGTYPVPFDSENLTLAETGPNTGVFTGSIELQTYPLASTDGILQTSRNGPPDTGYDSLRVYLGEVSDKASLTDSFLRFVDSQGEDATVYSLGDTVHVRLERQKINNPATLDVTFIRLRSITTNDDFEFILTETGADTGVFLGSIPTRGGPRVFGDGILQAQPGETIEASVFESPIPSLDRARILPNQPPVAQDDTVATLEDTSVTVAVLANDADPDGQTLTVVEAYDSGSGSGTVVINPDSTITYTPYPDSFGMIEQVTYTVSDGADTATATLFIEVAEVPDPPVAMDDAAVLFEDNGVTIDVLANDFDPEGQLLEVTAVTQGANGTAAIVFNEVEYNPNPNFSGTDSFTYTVTDTSGASSTATVTVTVEAMSDPPLANDDAATTNEDAAVVIAVTVNDSDPDGQPLVTNTVSQPLHGTAVVNPNGTITYTPAANFSGTDSFDYTLRDFEQPTWGATATVTVTVNPVNDPPVATADAAATRENVSITITVLANDSDVEGNPLSITGVSNPPGGTAVVNANYAITYTADANFNGTDTFTYTLYDGQGGTATGTVTVMVKDALERVAILGTHGVWIQTGADVLSGDVIANHAGAAPFLDGGGSEISIAGTVTTPSGYDVQGDSMNVASGATVAGDAFYNQRTGTGVITGTQTSPLALPVFTTLPAFNTAMPGSSDVNVANNGTRTLAAGSYRDLIVGRKGTVTFTGGIYHFRSIRIDREAKLFFSAATEVRVQQKVSTQTLTTIQPAAGATITGANILFYVAGLNGTGGGLAETPKAVEIGTDNVIRANVYAPNGTIWIKDRTQARGASLGKDVQIGLDAQVTLESAFAGQ